MLRTGWPLLWCFHGGGYKDQPQMWTDTFLQTFATAGPSGQFWGPLKSHTHSAQCELRRASFLDTGLCAWGALRSPLQCQHAFQVFGRF